MTSTPSSKTPSEKPNPDPSKASKSTGRSSSGFGPGDWGNQVLDGMKRSLDAETERRAAQAPAKE